jgi:hypothetical protein
MAPGREIASFECSLCRDDFGELEHSMGPTYQFLAGPVRMPDREEKAHGSNSG